MTPNAWRRLDTALLVVIGACAVAALVLLATQAGHLVTALYLNADTTSAPVIARLMGGAAPHSVVTLGNYPWYEPMWLMLATRWLPARREVWVIAPFAFYALALALVAWSTWVTFGRRAALLVVAPLLCVSYGMREIVFTPDWHGAAIVTACVADGALVVMVTWWSRMRAIHRVALGTLLAVVIAAGETDLLTLATTVGPLAGAALVVYWNARSDRNRAIAIFAAVVAGAGVIGGTLASRAMRAAGIVPHAAFHVGLAISNLPEKARLLLQSLAYLGGGHPTAAASTLATKASSAVTLGLTALVLAWMLATAIRAVSGGRWLRARAPSRQGEPDPTLDARTAHAAFWALVLVCTFGAFLLTTPPAGVLSARYFAAGFLAVFALLPLVWRARRGAHSAVVAAIAVYAALAVGHIASIPLDGYGSGPSEALARDVERYVRDQGATEGFAEYRDAAVITWETRFHTLVYPVLSCPAPPGICPFFLHTISSWYRPTLKRYFLVTDSAPDELAVASPPPALGAPLAHAGFGYLTVYVYGVDRGLS